MLFLGLLTLSMAARSYGLEPDMVQARLKRGDLVSEALRPTGVRKVLRDVGMLP